jgi:hypothetical protein
MGRLQLGVGLVLGVTAAVVGQGDDLMWRIVRPVQAPIGLVAVGARAAVLVDVVAQVHDRVEAVEFGDLAVGVEVAVRVEGATGDGEDDVLGWSGRQGAEATDRGDGVLRHCIPGDLACAVTEAVEILGAGLEPCHVDLDGPVAVGPRFNGDGLYDRGEGGSEAINSWPARTDSPAPLA